MICLFNTYLVFKQFGTNFVVHSHVLEGDIFKVQLLDEMHNIYISYWLLIDIKFIGNSLYWIFNCAWHVNLHHFYIQITLPSSNCHLKLIFKNTSYLLKLLNVIFSKSQNENQFFI